MIVIIIIKAIIIEDITLIVFVIIKGIIMFLSVG